MLRMRKKNPGPGREHLPRPHSMENRNPDPGDSLHSQLLFPTKELLPAPPHPSHDPPLAPQPRAMGRSIPACLGLNCAFCAHAKDSSLSRAPRPSSRGRQQGAPWQTYRAPEAAAAPGGQHVVAGPCSSPSAGLGWTGSADGGLSLFLLLCSSVVW